MQSRLFKLRFRRRLKNRQKQAKELNVQAEAGFEKYFLNQDVCRAGDQEAGRTAIVVAGSVGPAAKA